LNSEENVRVTRYGRSEKDGGSLTGDAVAELLITPSEYIDFLCPLRHSSAQLLLIVSIV